MTDRIRSGFETWAQKQGFSDLTQNMGRSSRPGRITGRRG